jgi:DNA-binding transcriptional LysR family regulator
MGNDDSSPKAARHINERRLSYLFAAVEAKSIRGAADRLDIEPSVVSRQIQILERELEAVLLDRHGRGVDATDAGRLVLEYYRRHLSNEATVLSQLEELKGLQRGDVHIAASEGFIESLIETVLHEFNRKYPNVRITLNATPASSIVKLVAEERINIGLAFAPPPSNRVQIFARKRHPLYVIARHDHPIADQAVVPNLQALAELPFCLVPEEFGIGQLIKLAEHSTHVSLHRAMETNSLLALRYFVTSGLGLTILPKILVQKELDTGLLKAVRIRNPSLETAEGQIIVPRRAMRSIAEETLLQSLTSLPWFV